MASRADGPFLRILAVAALLSGAEASAQAAPPPVKAPPKAAPVAPVDPLQAEVDDIHRMAVVGIWRPGKSAIDKFFVSHAGDKRVMAHLPGLESDLSTFLFRLSEKQPTPAQLLGGGVTKYDPGTGRIEIRAETVDEREGWIEAEDVRLLDILFETEVSVQVFGGDARDVVVMLGFDVETRGAYAFVPARSDFLEEDVEPRILRIDPGTDKPVELARCGLVFTPPTTEWVRYSLTPGKVVAEIQRNQGWNPKDRHETTTVADTTYRRGYVAIRGMKGPVRLRSPIAIAGKIDKTFASRHMAEADARRFRDWKKGQWHREASLPPWVLAMEKEAGGWAENLPADLPKEARDGAARLQRMAFEGGARGAPAPTVPAGLTGIGGDWVEALAALREDRFADAFEATRRVLEAAPEFAPAHVLAGRAHLERGAEDAAVQAFEEARRLAPSFAPAYDGLALVAFRNGDLERMRAVLSDAAGAGASTSLTAELRRALLCMQRGPDWKKKYESGSANFAVTGDASGSVSLQVLATLEEAFEIYGREFRPRPRKVRARVRVFSGFESYAAYVAELGADPTNSLGMYLPAIRELCIFLHEDRPMLSNTIRHEAFHQYLHQFLEEAPIWFNEGYAEFFGFSRRRKVKGPAGPLDAEQKSLAKTLLPKFTPLRELFLMEPEAFMAKPALHYVESWAVIHLLRAPSDPALKGLLDRYLDALVAGRSQAEAYEEVLGPRVEAIETALKAHVADMSAK